MFDDVDLPFGRLRLRAAGGAGGHHGLADVIERLGAARLRAAALRRRAGPRREQETADHVLEAFSAAEQARAARAHRARRARARGRRCATGVAAAMNEFNRDPEAESPRRMSDARSRRRLVDLLQEFSIPLLFGVAAAMVAANVDPDGYQRDRALAAVR